ncbi:MAG: hypothetical protein AAF846_25740 [Chloroflexota bacterium]
MSYEQPEPHLSFRQYEQIYLLGVKEVNHMLEDDGAGGFIQREQREQYLGSLNIDRYSSKAQSTLAHCACNDRNREGTGLGHLTSHERPRTLIMSHISF